MIITFNKISYKNILSVGNQPITIDLKTNKKTLITGKNGGGKSTLLEALCFVLFGKPFRSIKKNQLVNSINKKSLLVELDFSDGKHNYTVKRGIKPNVFEIKRNGEEIAESASVKDFQLFFETDIIKMNIQSFKQTIILGTAGYTPFMELSAGNRRALIEDLINLAVFSKMDQLNKSVVKETKAQMDALELTLTGLRNEYDAHMHHIEKQRQMSDAFIAELQNTYATQVDIAVSTNNDILALNTELTGCTACDDVSDKLKRCNSALAVLDSKVKSLDDHESFFEHNDSCPTCKQQITESHKQSIINSNSALRAEYSEKRASVIEILNECKGALDLFNESQKTIARIRAEIKAKTEIVTNAAKLAKAIKAKIDAAKAETSVDMNRIDELNEKIKESRILKTELFEEMYARKIVLNMLKDSGIKSIAMKKYIPVINKKINQYLKMLGADYTFTLDEEFNETIKSRGREDFSYTSFSQGEKARIDLSLLFTWRDVASVVSGTQISLLILDEVFDSATDGEGVKAIHTILESIDSNVVVISHREEHDKTNFNQHLRMVKKGRYTTMEVANE